MSFHIRSSKTPLSRLPRLFFCLIAAVLFSSPVYAQALYSSSGGSFDNPFDSTTAVGLYYTYSKSDTTIYTPSMLTSHSTTNVYVVGDGATSYCADRCVKRAYLRISFHVGGVDKEYTHGKVSGDSALVTLKLDGVDPGNSLLMGLNIASFTMKIKLVDPDSIVAEQVYIYDLTSVYPDHCTGGTPLDLNRIQCQVTSYTAPITSSIASEVRLELRLVEEYALGAIYSASTTCDDETIMIQPLLPQDVVNDNPVVFKWGNALELCMSDSFPNYHVQLLRLFNRDTTYRNDSLVIATKIDWNKALNIETYGPKQEVELTVPEGTGFYVWRVRPIGNFYANGIGNDSNWGCWSKAPAQDDTLVITLADDEISSVPTDWHDCLLYYEQFNDTLNWIYSRTFSEGQDSRPGISEQITFANGLLQPYQKQARPQSQDSVLASATVYDFSGRPALSSLGAPVAQDKLEFVPSLLARNSGVVYSAKHFDENANWQQPEVAASGPINAYYSNANPDLTIPSADTLPYSRTFYQADAGGRVMEQSAPGATHSKGTGRGGRTVKTFYASISDKELVSVFGDEAPIDTAVTKVTTIDQNEVASVSYQSKEGQVLATCLVRATTANLLPLDNETVNALDFIDTVQNDQSIGEYSLKASKTIYLPSTVANFVVKYGLDPVAFSSECQAYCALCDYRIIRKLRRVAPDTATILLDTFHLISHEPLSCSLTDPDSIQAEDETFTLPPGLYVAERIIETNTKDESLEDPVPSLDRHVGILKERFADRVVERMNTIFDSTALAKYHDVHVVKTDSLYEALLDNYVDYYNGLGESKVDSLANCCQDTLPPSPCDNGSDWCGDTTDIQFEQYLFDWGAANDRGLTTNLNDYFRNIDTTIKYPSGTVDGLGKSGAFNRMIAHMISSGGYSCKQLWRCWESLVAGLEQTGFKSDTNGNFIGKHQIGFDLLERFLDCTGRKLCSFSGTAYSGNGFLDYAWRIYPEPDEDCQEALGYTADPGDTLWACGIGHDSAAHANHEKLYGCYQSKHYRAFMEQLRTEGVIKDAIEGCGEDLACIEKMVQAMIDSCTGMCESRRREFRDSIATWYSAHGFFVEGYGVYDSMTVYGGILGAYELSCLVEQLVKSCREDCNLSIVTNETEDSITHIGTAEQIKNFQSAYGGHRFHVEDGSEGCDTNHRHIEELVPIGKIVVDMLNFYLQRYRDTTVLETSLWDYTALWDILVAHYPTLDSCSKDQMAVLVSKSLPSHFEYEMNTEVTPHECSVKYHDPDLHLPDYTQNSQHPLINFLNAALNGSWGGVIPYGDFDKTDSCNNIMDLNQQYTWIGGGMSSGTENPLLYHYCYNDTLHDWEFCDFKVPCINGHLEDNASEYIGIDSYVSDVFHLSPTDPTLRVTGTIYLRIGAAHLTIKMSKWSCTGGGTNFLDTIRLSWSYGLFAKEHNYVDLTRDELTAMLKLPFTEQFGRFEIMADGSLAFRDRVNGFLLPIPEINLHCTLCADTSSILCNGSGLCDSVSCGSLCFRWIDSLIVDSAKVSQRAKSCAQQAVEYLVPLLEGRYSACMEVAANELRSEYKKQCATPGAIDDLMTLSYGMKFEHYTLYYYDRAGNLIKTIPPKGVDLSKADTCTRMYHPPHTYPTEYEYNSLKQLVRQQTPDGGETKFWYNAAGQLRLSQNAKQVGSSVYSYTKYDPLGRIYEVGETGITGTEQSFADDTSKPSSGATQITTTVYTIPASGVSYQPGSLAQRYLQNRVSYTTSSDGVNTYYSYDPHGNVEWLIQDVPGLGKNYIRYSYDLVSGKVTEVSYQEGKPDQFYERYSYDDDSRITMVETSRDHWIWERDASYRYYPHGPLRRMELGTDKLQGLDYVYTIQGWLKGINHPAPVPGGSLDSSYDAGADAVGSSHFAKDAFGMILGYYEGDFNRSYSGTNSKYNSGSSGAQTYNLGGTGLYNGNISTWASTIMRGPSGNSLVYEDLTGYRYTYDRLNRLKSDNFRTWDTTTSAWVGLSKRYASSYTYDPNGNIRTLNRSANNVDMDKQTYVYYESSGSESNRLRRIDEDGTISGSTSTVDIDDQSNDNYTYDDIGNLIGDEQESLPSGNIKWNVYGKVTEVTRHRNKRMRYYYDASGNRVKKELYTASGSSYNLSKTTWYIRDASGNVLGVYEKSVSGDTATKLIELPIYGSERVGEVTPSQKRYATAPDSGGIFSRYLEKKSYELKDHLGNVRVTVSDVKLPASGGIFKADMKSYANYYPFGMLQSGRNWQSSSYRYGYNGKEMDNEIKGTGTELDYGERMYDPRVGRFLSMDPLTKSFPMLTPYQFASNTPIWAIDLDGEEARVYTETKGTGHTFITVQDGDKITLYTYGRYAGGDWYTLTTTGDGVLVRYTGDKAVDYLRTELYKMEAKAYEIRDVDQNKVKGYLDALYNSSTEAPDVHNSDIKEYGRVIDTYSLFGNNCTSISCDALKHGGTNIFDMETLLFNYDEDFTIPSSLSNFLETKSKAKTTVIDVTQQLKRDLANTDKKSPLKSAGSSGTSSGSSGDSSGSSAASGDVGSSGNGSGSFGSGSGNSSSQDHDKPKR